MAGSTVRLIMAGLVACHLTAMVGVTRVLMPIIKPMAAVPMAIISTTCRVRALLSHKSLQILLRMTPIGTPQPEVLSPIPILCTEYCVLRKVLRRMGKLLNP